MSRSAGSNGAVHQLHELKLLQESVTLAEEDPSHHMILDRDGYRVKGFRFWSLTTASES